MKDGAVEGFEAGGDVGHQEGDLTGVFVLSASEFDGEKVVRAAEEDVASAVGGLNGSVTEEVVDGRAVQGYLGQGADSTGQTEIGQLKEYAVSVKRTHSKPTRTVVLAFRIDVNVFAGHCF